MSPYAAPNFLQVADSASATSSIRTLEITTMDQVSNLLPALLCSLPETYRAPHEADAYQDVPLARHELRVVQADGNLREFWPEGTRVEVSVWCGLKSLARSA